MATTLQLPAHSSWASAHRAVLIVLGAALAVIVAVTVALLVTGGGATTTDNVGETPNYFRDSCYAAPAGTAC